MAQRHNTFCYFQTNHPNLLGGWMTYDNMSDAIRACEGGWGTEVYVCTILHSENNLGIEVRGALCKVLWRDLVWTKKGRSAQN